MHPSGAFEARFSPFRSILFSLVSFGFVAIGLWMLGAFGEVPDGSRRVPDWAVPIIGWLCFLFFSAAGLVNLRNAISGGLAARIDAAGVSVPTLSQDVIAWEDIGHMRKVNVMGNDFIVLEVDDTRSRSFKLQARIYKRLNGGFYRKGEWSLVVTSTGHSADELLEVAREFRPVVASHRIVGG